MTLDRVAIPTSSRLKQKSTDISKLTPHKVHRQVDQQETAIAELKSTVAQQQNGIEVLIARIEQQASQIRNVSAQLARGRVRQTGGLEVSKNSVPKMVANNQ
jgi:hypothetical protein